MSKELLAGINQYPIPENQRTLNKKDPSLAGEATRQPSAEPIQEPDDSYDLALESAVSPEKGDPYDAVLSNAVNAPRDALEGSLFVAKDTNPDQQAKVLQLSEKLRLPPSVISGDLENFEKQANTQRPDEYDDLLEKATTTAEWLSDPENAKLAHDDIQGLSYIERQVRHIGQQFTAGQRTTELSDIGGSAFLGTITPEQRRRQAEIDKELSLQKDYGITGFFESVPGFVSNQLPIFGKTLKTTAATTAIGAGIGAAAGLATGPGVLATGATGAFWGYRIGSAMGAAQMEGNLAYLDLEKERDAAGQPLDRATMIGAATAVGAINGALETIGMESVLKAAPGFQAFKRGGIKQIFQNPTTREALLKFGKAVGESTATEGGTEFLQSIVGSLSKTMAKAYQDGELPTWDSAKVMESLGEAWQEGRAGAGAGGGMTVVTGGASLALDAREVRKADQRKAALLELGEAVKNSKTHSRSPEAVGDIVAGSLEEGKDSVFVPFKDAQVYFQSKGMDIDQAAAELGVADELEAARATNGDIKIPLKTWAEKVVGTEHEVGLADDVKLFDPNTFTARQTKEKQKAAEAEVQEAEKKAVEEPAEEPQSKLRISEHLTKQLKAAGLTAEEVRQNPKLYESLFSTAIERENISPEQLEDMFRVNVGKFESREAMQKESESFDFGANVEGEAVAQPGGAAPESRLTMRDVSGSSKEEKIAMAKRALEAVPDLHKDDVAEALGLPKMSVRALKGISERKGRGVYSKEEILKAGGADQGQTFEQKAANPWKMPSASPDGTPFKSKVNIANLSASSVKLQAGENIKHAAKRLAKSLMGVGIINDQTGWKVDVPSKGINEAGESASELNHAVALANLGEIFRNAVYVTSEADRKGREEIKAVHKFYAPIRVDGKDLLARIQVNETTSGEKFYDQVVVEKEDPGVVNGGPSAGQASSPLRGVSDLSIADFGSEISQAKQVHPYFQGDKKDPRGEIHVAGNQFFVALFKARDKSTFLHETGHFFLEFTKKLAEREGASQGIKEDWAALREWMGLKEGEEITTEHHEKFARGFETYLSEGKAPSLKLRDAFASFRQWLTSLWRKVNFDRVEVSPEVKEIFDRLLATEDEIAAAKKEVSWFEDNFPGIDPETKDRLQRLREKARIQVEEELLDEKLKETKEGHRKLLDRETRRFTKEAEKELALEPLFAAIESIRTSGKKRVDPYKIAAKITSGEFGAEEAELFEVTADEQGFVSAQDLARAVENAGKEGLYDKKVSDIVKQKLLEAGLLRDAQQLKTDALKAIHEENMTQVLALEREALLELAASDAIRDEVKKRNKEAARIEAQAAKEEAARIISQKPALEAARTGRYITMERQAAARASELVAKKKYALAAQAKREQMIAHALVRESFRISEEMDKHLRYLDQFTNRKGSLLDMPFGFVRQVDQILANFGMRKEPEEDIATLTKIAKSMDEKGEDSAAIANATGLELLSDSRFGFESLESFVARANEDNRAMIIAPMVLNSTDANVDDLSIKELRDLRDAVQTIVQFGRKHDRLSDRFGDLSVRDAGQGLRIQVENKIGTPKLDDNSLGAEDSGIKAKVKAFLDLPDTMIPALVNIETLVNFLDLKNPDGWARKLIYRPMAEAENRKQELREKAILSMRELLAKHYTQEELAAYKTEKRYTIPGIKKQLSREQILAMALNWGNETNRDRLMRGDKISEATVAAALDNLDKRDWEFVQEAWDYLDSFWPEIVALEMKVSGVEPKKVESKKVVTKFGVFRGGYYPISYDFGKNADAYLNEQQRSALYKSFSAASAHTDKGHTQSRVNRVTGRPLRLSLGVMFDHVEDVVHDLAYREAVIDLARLLKQPDFKSAIQNSVGVKALSSINQWVQGVAADQRSTIAPGEGWLPWFRHRATLATLSFRYANMAMDVAGNLGNVAWEIGPAGMIRVIGRTRLVNSIRRFSFMGELEMDPVSISTYMKTRENTLDRDLYEVSKKWTTDRSLADKMVKKITGKNVELAQFAFFFQRFADSAIARPLWVEAYKQSLGKFSQEEAIAIADDTVKRTLGSGASIDLVGIQRGSETQKLFTMYYSWASMMFNRAWLDGKLAGVEYRNENYLPALAITAKAMFFAWGLQAVVENLFREALFNTGGGEADDEDRLKRIASRVATQPFAYVPFARDIAAGAVQAATKGRGGVKLSPVEGAFESIFLTPMKGGYYLFTDPEKLDQKYMEESVRAASLLMGSPQALNTLAFNLLDYAQENGEANWKDFMSRRHKK